MRTIDYVIFGLLIAVCLAVGLAWIITKGKFVKYKRELTKDEERALYVRSIVAGFLFITIAILLAVSMVAMHLNIKWLITVSYAVVLVVSVCFMVLTRIIYRRKR